MCLSSFIFRLTNLKGNHKLSTIIAKERSRVIIKDYYGGIAI